MKLLILGATGYIGSKFAETLASHREFEVVCVSRGHHISQSVIQTVRVDTRDLPALTLALRQCDCVINCVAGSYDAIAKGAETLTRAALDANCKRIVHLSSMAVYGRNEGRMREDAPFDPLAGWYARAKCEAERYLQTFVGHGGEAVILRPGCVFGPACELWVGRIARWLLSQRLGDIGPAGDGWSNLVHRDDVCAAILAAVKIPVTASLAFNLACPDCPRWNDYFIDLATAVNATPVRRMSSRRLKMDSIALGAPLKVAERLLDRAGVAHAWLPEPLPPSVLRLWPQEIRLDVQAASRQLQMNWTGYGECVEHFSDWYAACRR